MHRKGASSLNPSSCISCIKRKHFSFLRNLLWWCHWSVYSTVLYSLGVAGWPGGYRCFCFFEIQWRTKKELRENCRFSLRLVVFNFHSHIVSGGAREKSHVLVVFWKLNTLSAKLMCPIQIQKRRKLCLCFVVCKWFFCIWFKTSNFAATLWIWKNWMQQLEYENSTL